jgi:O-6-methylguanine DNA methyltransferase
MLRLPHADDRFSGTSLCPLPAGARRPGDHVWRNRAFQAVGQALRRNPYAPAVPCHRVVSADGALHGFNGKTARCELCRKQELLEAEGVRIEQGRIADWETTLYKF